MPFPWFDPRSTIGRVLLCACVGVGIAWSCPGDWGAATVAIAGWDGATMLHLTLVWFGLFTQDARQVAARAAEEDPGRLAVLVLVLLASVVGMVAAFQIIRSAEVGTLAGRTLFAGLGFWAVVSAWAVTHTAFTLRYAHLYYDDAGQPGGLDFPGGEEPDDFDFAYFAFTIGMCFQVSDVAVSRSAFRRWVLAHSVLSFAYNTAIVALTINLLAGLLH